jgi:hypothetical protein
LVSSGALRLLAIVLLGVGSTANAVNVDDFGAVGDGKTWDHNAIQAAINAAGIGGVVEFSPGKVYVQCKNLLPAQGQVLRGNGAILKRCDPPLARLLEDAAAGRRS